MNVILLSGGSGRRLWPLSGDVRSKQFIPVFRRDDGSYESMVQRMYRQIRAVDPDAKVTVATAGFQAGLLKEQLGEEVGISIEPERRDTFPAIVLATAYLKDKMSISDDDSVVVCPVDPYVEEDYFRALSVLSERAKSGSANLVLMGMEPTYPAEIFGYVIPETSDEISRVSSFKEKPDEKTAREFIEKGALWNGGVFAYRIGYMMEKAKEITGYGDYKELFDNYASLTKISFDYAVAEKESSIEILRFGGRWEDLGTFDTLTGALAMDVLGRKEGTDELRSGALIGDALLDETCENVHVLNETDMPVLAMGLKNVVIALSKDGLLVADKDAAPGSKKYVDRILG
ncbi:MAG: mannose-1-phosphate guanylyltransferase [Lachnospiraceae bacterium]|nr:mannose-1-phosphate guanylyltransferase [Lachnospiraceae bacterium]